MATEEKQFDGSHMRFGGDVVMPTEETPAE